MSKIVDFVKYGLEDVGIDNPTLQLIKPKRKYRRDLDRKSGSTSTGIFATQDQVS